MAKAIVGVTIHNVPHEAEMDAIEGMVHKAKCKSTWHKHMTQCKVKGTQAQIDAFVKEYRG